MDDLMCFIVVPFGLIVRWTHQIIVFRYLRLDAVETSATGRGRRAVDLTGLR